jgi:hypothetical protein
MFRMKGRIGSSMGLDRKAMKAYYQAASQAGRSKRVHRSPLGHGGRRVVVVLPARKAA